jgi:transcriptional regulator with XRE-family HTH domain
MNEEELFGRRLARLREAAGMSQPALAEAAGVPVTTLRNWERGRRQPLALALGSLADALGVTADELLGRKPGGGNQEAPPTAGEKPAPKQAPGKRRRKAGGGDEPGGGRRG